MGMNSKVKLTLHVLLTVPRDRIGDLLANLLPVYPCTLSQELLIKQIACMQKVFVSVFHSILRWRLIYHSPAVRVRLLNNLIPGIIWTRPLKFSLVLS